MPGGCGGRQGGGCRGLQASHAALGGSSVANRFDFVFTKNATFMVFEYTREHVINPFVVRHEHMV